jgi:hypothetical protein
MPELKVAVNPSPKADVYIIQYNSCFFSIFFLSIKQKKTKIEINKEVRGRKQE